jgi:hypothetical protein
MDKYELKKYIRHIIMNGLTLREKDYEKEQ